MRIGLFSDMKNEAKPFLLDFIPPWRNEQRTEAKNKETEQDYCSTYEERLKYTPVDDTKGQWEGARGEGKFIPSNMDAQTKLKKLGVDGVEYRNAVPDFRPVSLAEVTIEMTPMRLSYMDGNKHVSGNYERADKQCAELWNKQGKDNRTDWSPGEVRDYRKDHKLTWHECSDMKTCLLVPSEIHSACGHSGGRMECAIRDGVKSGGGFDD